MIEPVLPTKHMAGHADLRNVAENLEVSFMSEMLKHAGLGKASESFGGGIGEEQFGSFLREEQARALVSTGGLGLADQIFKSLVARRDGGV